MTLTIASGKGGTGKTTVAVNLAWALAARGENVRLLDCDVEEPNDHLFVTPSFTETTSVKVPKPVCDPVRCTGCGACAKACNYHAIAVVKRKVLIFNELCHSCGVCTYVCPEQALQEVSIEIGRVQMGCAEVAGAAGGRRSLHFAHGLLNIGEALAPTVVQGVKAHLDPQAINLIDAAPGTACPVVAAVGGSDAVLLVTEPTPFGLNDLKLAVGLTLKMGVPTGILVNRSDGEDKLIAGYAAQVGLPIAGRIPFSRAYAEAYSGGAMLAERFPELRDNLLAIFDNLRTALPPVPLDDGFEIAVGEPPARRTGAADRHREVTVISGKGGTGKTTLVGSLAHLSDETILADNDVDAADLHLLLAPRVREAHDFTGGIKVAIDPETCANCGRCAMACHFHAIRQDGPVNCSGRATYRVDPMGCEGCGLCQRVCPVGAIASVPNITGRLFLSDTAHGPMVHARLGIAEENSGRLVAQVRDQAATLAGDLRLPLILGDGPPGTGCPVIASVTGTDLVVIVTEPTVSGVHDLVRVLKLACHFGVPARVVINKADLNDAQALRIDQLAAEHEAPVIGRIPFDREVNAALMAGKTVIEHGRGPAVAAIREIWTALQQAVALGTSAG